MRTIFSSVRALELLNLEQQIIASSPKLVSHRSFAVIIEKTSHFYQVVFFLRRKCTYCIQWHSIFCRKVLSQTCRCILYAVAFTMTFSPNFYTSRTNFWDRFSLTRNFWNLSMTIFPNGEWIYFIEIVLTKLLVTVYLWLCDVLSQLRVFAIWI